MSEVITVPVLSTLLTVFCSVVSLSLYLFVVEMGVSYCSSCETYLNLYY
jgi:hypothetical protein